MEIKKLTREGMREQKEDLSKQTTDSFTKLLIRDIRKKLYREEGKYFLLNEGGSKGR
ncbi:MAG: hypothetical protein ABIG28_01555 [archaeon]